MKNFLEIPINEFSSPIIAQANLDMSVKEMIMLMDRHGFRHLPVVDNKKPVGIISARDLKVLRLVNKDLQMKAKEIMIEDPFCVISGAPMEAVAFDMSERKIGSALVVNDAGELDSIFTSVDGLNALVEVLRGDYNQ